MSVQIILLSLLVLLSLISCSATPPAGKLIDGHLRPCPNRPNCVNSDSGDSDSDSVNSVAPISFSGSPDEAWHQIQQIIEELGGEIHENNGKYLTATFTSTIFHFIDDVELRMESKLNRMHIRSGARFGYSDLGVNKKRVQKIRKFFQEKSTEKDR